MTNYEKEDNYTNFGYKKVSFENKKLLVHEIFSNVATKYDLMNDLMSFGMHRCWKDEFCKHIPDLNSTILDVAGGTGDIAFKIINRAKHQGKMPHVILCDINPKMLSVAYNKAIDNNLFKVMDFICADGENLPFADNSFDYYTIAFGIRNIPHMESALREAYRVLKPSGKFLCLEFSKLKAKPCQKLYDFYSFNIIPKIGALVTRNKEAYQYLAESINLFPDQESFKVMIQDAGFEQVNYKNLTLGIVSIYSAYKL